MALREAVTNLVRHSGAESCRVKLHRREPWLELMVRDDGRGGAQAASGLDGMRRRIAALGGELSIETDAGTRLLVRLPIAGVTGMEPVGGAVTEDAETGA